MSVFVCVCMDVFACVCVYMCVCVFVCHIAFLFLCKCMRVFSHSGGLLIICPWLSLGFLLL